jgi:hypothetical protein
MIPKEALIRKFWLVSPEALCEDLVVALRALPAKEQSHWHAVLEVDTGRWAVVSPSELSEALERQGESMLGVPLNTIKGLGVASQAIERESMGIGQARRVMYKQPKRRLVVLEDGRPVGLLSDVFHAGLLGGLFLELFGKRHRPRRQVITFTCPQCEAVSDFVDLIDPETNQLICPICQALIVEDVE